MDHSANTYTRGNPFLATIIDRYPINKPGSQKVTKHIVLDIAGSNLKYNAGDSIGIYPDNDPDVIRFTLRAMQATGEETVFSKQTESYLSLKEFLTKKANITEISRKLLSLIMERQTDAQKKEMLQNLLAEGNREALKAYMESHYLWDLLEAHTEVKFEIQDLCDHLMPLLPRFYSAASSQKVVGNEVHLTVAQVEYVSNGHSRRGVCTHFLGEFAPLNQAILPIFVQPSHGFHLPENPEAPIIMIGPGTGIAPFRAFIQERERTSTQNWLFFGEWNRAYDYYYEDYLSKLEQEGKLKLSLAFSRDQEEKIYVQHKMLQQSKEFFDWLQKGAYVYVCGDAHYMAKDVEAALLKIIADEGAMGQDEAKAYVKKLRASKRYLKDVY